MAPLPNNPLWQLTSFWRGAKVPEENNPQMRTITLEEHFASPAFIDGPGAHSKERARTIPRFAKLIEQLTDIGAGRIGEMDAAGVDMQVLSTPDEAVAVARETNDYLAEAVKKNPTRFAAFAALPIMVPDQAAAELETRVRHHGFKGAVINGHNRGRYLDDKFYWPILECAEALGVPIHIHPTPPPKPVRDISYGGFDPLVSDIFASSGWGWHIETSVHVLRVILGGVFDRYPKLQLVIGHLGEGLPFMMQRYDNLPPAITKLQRPISDYLRQNVYYTFSGFNFPAAFLDLLLEVGVDRIMFSADHPYASMAKARAFLDQLPVSATDRERIAHGTAEKLFGM
jgi:hypothetical protein